MDSVHLPRRLLLAGLGSAAVAAATACTSGGTASTRNRPSSPATSAGQTSGYSGNEAALRRKISSLLVVGFRGERVKRDDWIFKAVNAGLGGVILFDRDLETNSARNIRSPEQVTALVKTLRDASPGRLIVSIDQEGGRTSRLNASNGFPATKSEAEVGAENSPSGTRQWARGLVASLTQIGVNLNYAPVVDLNVNPESRAIGKLDRSFSADPEVVVSNATEEIQVHRAAGVKTTLKHFPGSGSAAGNTDFEVVDVSDTWNESELEPFQRLIQAGLADSVMAAHVHNNQLDPKFPASLSTRTVTGLLRGQLGWQGPVVSDDMQAVAITRRYGAAEAVALALQAGLDLLVFANQQVYNPGIVEETIGTVVNLVRSGRLSEARIDESVARVDTLRPKR